MTRALLWISGASSGIGAALAATVPWEGARIIGISRSRPAGGVAHLEADLADPASWAAVGESFRRELDGFDGDHVVFVQAAGTIEPMGFAGEVDGHAYRANVLLNSAAPQVLGHLFLSEVRHVDADRALVMMTSGAARNVYPGWAPYGAAKAATDQWVRDVGAEQRARGGVRVVAIAPGTVDTDMQAVIRKTPEGDFPNRQKFIDLHEGGGLTPPEDVARTIWSLLDGDLESGSVVDLRELARK